VRIDNFFAELKRRNVYKVAVAYAIVGWLLVQIATQVFPFLEIPTWVVRLVIVLVAAGFPIALFIAWAFELTPEGIKRTEDVDPFDSRSGQVLAASARQPRKHAWIFVVIVGAALSIGLFFIGRYSGRNTPTPRQSEAATVSEKSIAVLPFDNLSRDPDNAFFAEGVQDEILTRLAKVADLKVIARTSTQKFKSAPENLPDIAKRLGVANILEGSVQKVNDQVRVNVQLINALTNAHLWAEIYDRKLSDIFAVQSDIAKTVADTLQAKLTGSEKQLMEAQPTNDTAAYELYHKGRSFWAKRSGDNIPKAIGFYQQAIERDPNYALAYAGLAIEEDASPRYLFPPKFHPPLEVFNLHRLMEIAEETGPLYLTPEIDGVLRLSEAGAVSALGLFDGSLSREQEEAIVGALALYEGFVLVGEGFADCTIARLARYAAVSWVPDLSRQSAGSPSALCA